ncbi:MAG: sulfide/dihydroorotate dehydrogenase-like FAD/NAD-binding protein [Nitrososphaerota archaeon]|nr:sulfide/dihydroorotate dehydrogenase-like FAD/NAD-binding protein [Nitrososphaerota archaeon]MDG6930034.1 sulfide/dihydroorotate dehydrogenase-like FAD/NAD-binding protein [Nitrososphaerota archaeon]MDG6931985.1 sulfide/dihydroorotate dehydrogenase-like FAD/NAD-binding protein [Nitrososphaerota archaeon]MDG6943812.1 sulfide/dihydroorotate dehydrogenase-like FAD/NAD-binding protein [Nitrososphaerota archaeon]
MHGKCYYSTTANPCIGGTVLDIAREGTILEKEELTTNIYEMKLYAPKIARAAHAGQFMLLMVDEKGERVPMTMVDWDSTQGWIDIVYQEVGTTTIKLTGHGVGDRLFYVAGPLGKPSRVGKFGRVVVIGGGVGVPAVYPIARTLKLQGNYVVSIIGAKTSNALVYEEKMKEVSDELIVTTDDGSRGLKGFTSDALRGLLLNGQEFNAMWSVGPTLMMKACSDVAAGKIPNSFASLNSLMVCGVGMCGACRVTVKDKILLTCVDGPEFISYDVNWKELAIRLKSYMREETVSLEMLRGADKL